MVARLGELRGERDAVTRFEGRDDPLGFGEFAEGGERLLVGAAVYSARPLDRYMACSGPTPG